MKRFASHYLLIPAVGFMKRQVIEVSNEGTIQRAFPLKEEMESVEWLPGVIALLTESQIVELENNEVMRSPITSLHGYSSSPKKRGDTYVFKEELFPCLFYPFDFMTMRPVGETRHRLLR